MARFSNDVVVGAWQRQKGKCAHCGARLGRDDVYDAHHQWPAASGGGNGLDNCVLVCTDCHKELHRGAPRGQVTYGKKMFPYKNG